ncbi:hypothetical protein CYLTODRAFT_57129 [Cylindrobasidium torrendii FP15055 ss-10]|uniref:Uncharacterized protein n=1 Tax=Cylindrobasidium torrendii FP15055 ss-10 TaxID=1314674 RepID=A0A0D7B6A1_9AGAR|nr:hypothetical protein CYLTODRAFT_57129 [Cylindrobasidium torrendii FP15055 ss-10]
MQFGCAGANTNIHATVSVPAVSVDISLPGPSGIRPSYGHSEADIELLESEVAALDADIATLSASLQALERQRQKASAHLHLHKGLLCRVHDLPTEILCQIFLYCLDSSDNAGSYDLFTRNRAYDGRTPPWDLTAVCHRWREVGLHMLRLWSAPTFVLGGSDKMYLFVDEEQQTEANCLTTVLRRAGNAPLTLDIDVVSQYTSNITSGTPSQELRPCISPAFRRGSWTT